MLHILKCDPAPFTLTWSGKKMFELRFNDRNYQPGDAVLLRETNHSASDMKAGAPLEYSGRVIHFIAPVVYDSREFGALRDGWVILSISDMTRDTMP